MHSLSPLERKCYWTLSNLHSSNELLQENTGYTSTENIYDALVEIFNQGTLDKKPTEMLHLEKFAINAEYAHIENDVNIAPKLKASRLKTLDEALIHLNNCLDDIELISKQPQKYAVKVKNAYGEYRKIIAPPSGDNVRKFVSTQSQRIGRMNQGMRSSSQMAFLASRQEALKVLGIIYTKLQCQALGLDFKKHSSKIDKDKGIER